VRPRDSFRLRARGTASAFASLDNSATPADAVFIAHASAEFYVDVMSSLSCKGDIFVAPMRPLAPHEVLLELKIEQHVGGVVTVIASQAPGDPGILVTLPPGAYYRILLNYKLRVPYGVDPDFDVDTSISFIEASTSTPALSPDRQVLLVLGLLAIGACALAIRRRMLA